MKKVVIGIIFFCSFLNNVYAETFYGDYYKVENIDGISDDQVKVDSYKVYNTYEVEYQDLGYLEDNEEFIKDVNDFIEEENIVDFVGNGDEYIKINTTESGKKKLHFSKLSQNLKIFEIEIYIDDKKINYEISNKSLFESYDQVDIVNINDGDYNTFYLNKSDLNKMYIVLKFNEVYLFNNMKIIIYTETGEDSGFTFLLERYKHVVLNNNTDRKHIISFKVSEDFTNDLEYSYINNVKKFRYYKENLKLLNEYIRDGNNIILDDYKIVSEYYKRDKLILSDDLMIKDNECDVSNFILFSSGEVKQECDINYGINGVYKCRFILNDINIEKDIFVNIEKNNKENNKETVINESINYEVTTINKTTKKIKKVLNNKIKPSNIIQTNNKKTTNKRVIKKDKNNNIKIRDNKSLRLKLIILFVFISIEIFLIRRNKKR